MIHVSSYICPQRPCGKYEGRRGLEIRGERTREITTRAHGRREVEGLKRQERGERREERREKRR